MRTTEPGSLPDTTGAIALRHRATARRRGAPTLLQWVGRIPVAWRTPGWRRTFAGWALAGAFLDMVTTMSVGHVDGVYEANPLSAAGQALVGSGPLYMLATTMVVGALMTVLAVRPVGVATRIVWWAVAVLGAAKIGVAVLNLTVLQGALDASIDRL